VIQADFDYFKLGLFHPFSLHMRLQICIGQVKVRKRAFEKCMHIKITKAGVIALGTDFPVEEVNPMLTFHAAFARKDRGILVLVFRWKMH
jgi:hypothetical protein